jgi:hypothetical protein
MRFLSRPPLGGLFLLSMLAACESGDPVAPAPPAAPAQLARLECVVTVATGAMRCTPSSPGLGDASGLIAGSQGQYVFLTASNHAYSALDSLYTLDVTVQNLLPQAMGTTDGATLDSLGIRVFFDTEPHAVGGNAGAELTLAGAVQRTTIMRASQAYYQYSEVLSPNETSGAVQWAVRMPPEVSAFHFGVLVMAEVQYPEGYVNVTPPADTLAEGQTVTLAASVVTQVGEPVTGETVTWGSSDAGVATVDGSGVVTAVAPGTTTITATAGVRSGQANIVVCPDLAVGEAYTAVMPAAASLCFAGDAAANAEYVYVPLNLSTSSSLSLSVTASGIVSAAGPPNPALLPGGAALARLAPAQLASGDDAHLARLERDRREVAGALRRGGARAPSGPARVITPGVPAVGDLWDLNVSQSCSGALDQRTGRVRSVGSSVIIVADTANPAGGFTTAQYDSIALEFDTIAYAVNSAAFGAPSDTDGNARVVVFYTRAMNELSPPASGALTYAEFRTRDLFEATGQGCTGSNVGELLYALVPDPTGAVNSNVRSVPLVRGNTIRELGHELQHLINASRRLYVVGTSNLEEAWLNEGLSGIAEELMFYRTAVGLAPRGNIVLSTLTTGPNASRRVAAFNTYQNTNFTRLRSWLQRPDTSGAFKNAVTLTQRGATWGYLRYAADRRNGSDAALWTALVTTSETGKANLQTVLGADPDAWLRDWIAAMYADDVVAGIGPELQTTSWHYRSIYGGLGGVPHLTRALSNGTALTLSYSRGGGSSFIRFGVPANGFATVTALSCGVAPTSPYSLIVVRTK